MVSEISVILLHCLESSVAAQRRIGQTTVTTDRSEVMTIFVPFCRYTPIADISLKDSIFLAKVALPVGLKTTYGKQLSYKTGMTASADIITEDTRLLEKLFYQLRKVTNGR